MANNPHQPPHEFHIQIDRVHYTTTAPSLTGAQLRQLVTPPIPPERDLFQVRPGDSDLLIEDATVVRMHDGLRFFTAPRNINPG